MRMMHRTHLVDHQKGQSMVEFALVVPLLILVIVGIFELGRAFFAYIAITNAAREGVRIYTFTPDKTTFNQINETVTTEIGSASAVDPNNIASINISCGIINIPVNNDTDLDNCPSEQPITVTVTYSHELILGMFFTQPIMLGKSAEMMKP
jgi:Flp pilus assembly protein TadG